MKLDADDVRETRQIGSTAEWVSHFSERLIGQLPDDIYDAPAVQGALGNWSIDAEKASNDQLFQQHAYFDLSVTETGALVTKSTYVMPNVSAEDAAGFKRALSTTCLSMLEVKESKRGKGVRFQDHLLNRTVFVSDAELATTLEPMEAVVGRLVEWNGQMYLLPNWEKLRFRGRKAAIAKAVDMMNEEGLDADDLEFRTAWLRRQAQLVARISREA